MTHRTIPTDAVDDAKARFRGGLVGPSDPEYEDVRRVHNGLIDRRLALVARCAGTSDVVTALELAREHGPSGQPAATEGGPGRSLGRLPEDCSMDDVRYHLYVIQQIDRGLADIVARFVAPPEQLRVNVNVA